MNLNIGKERIKGFVVTKEKEKVFFVLNFVIKDKVGSVETLKLKTLISREPPLSCYRHPWEIQNLSSRVHKREKQ